MSETSIAWTDYTFNPWWGCVRVSPGCENCYAETFSHRLGLDLWGPTSGRRFFEDKHWNDPIRWAKRREKGDARHRVFCASMADVFERHDALDAERNRLFALIEATPNLTWQLLTKRPENVMAMVPASWRSGFPPNVWPMVTAEDQARANLRIPLLLQIPAAVHGVSYEPALEAVDFSRWLAGPDEDGACTRCGNAFEDPAELSHTCPPGFAGINWLIVGGESGHDGRYFSRDWARDARDQCAAAGVAFFYKQGGHYLRCNHDAKGGCWDCTAQDLKVREFPAA